MSEKTTFTSDTESLHNLLKHISEGKIQLPEFQRGWIWDDAHVKSLLASVSLSYPIGSVMVLETGNPDVRFKPRPIEGVELADNTEPERYILDGQQRMTSLFQSLFLKQPVVTSDTRGNEISRWYYMGMNEALQPDSDREECILSLPENKIRRNFRNEVIADYSTSESEYQNDLFPLMCVFDCADWRTNYQEYWDYDRNKIKLFNEFEKEVIKRFEQYMVPVIKLFKQTPKEAICQVFEKVNTGGVSLTVFELLTATFAADEFDLRQDWNEKRRILTNIDELGSVAKVLNAVQNDDVLQAITLLTTYDRREQYLEMENPPDRAPGISCKRRDILRLTLTDYRKWAAPVIEGFIKAGRLIYSQNIFSAKDLPYRTQLIPLAAIFTWLGEKADQIDVKEKLIRWYWCGVLGELYGGATETRIAQDLPDVLKWIHDGATEPRTVTDANFNSSRLYTLQTRNSAAYKGIYALLMRDGCQDFITGDTITDQTYFDDRIDIHHIFPRNWCMKQDIDRKLWNCISNKTPLASKTNKTIGGNVPSIYLQRIMRTANINHERLEEVLSSHLIDSEAMWNDDLGSFLRAREAALLNRIESIIGKPVVIDSPEYSLQ